MEFKTIEVAINEVFGAAVLVHETDVFVDRGFKPALAVCAHPQVLKTVRHFCDTRFGRPLSKDRVVGNRISGSGRRVRCSEFFIF